MPLQFHIPRPIDTYHQSKPITRGRSDSRLPSPPHGQAPNRWPSSRYTSAICTRIESYPASLEPVPLAIEPHQVSIAHLLRKRVQHISFPPWSRWYDRTDRTNLPCFLPHSKRVSPWQSRPQLSATRYQLCDNAWTTHLPRSKKLPR